MKKNILTTIFIACVGIALFSATPAKADPAPYFGLTATEGQGAGSDEFYVGRCFEVGIYLNTGGYNSNAADVEINYDNSVVQVVQNDCSTEATTVYTDGLFNTYPSAGNEVSSTKLLLSAYNNPGVSTNVSNGLYGHFFLKVLTASSSFNLDFEYTQDLTTDTNLAETDGTGEDILQSVENLTLQLLDDTDDPDVTSQSPASATTGVSISSNVTMYLYDAMAGINSGTASARMKESSGSWHSQSISAGSVQSTNENRYWRYTGTINPDSNIKTNGGYYEYDTAYTVEITVSDLDIPTAHTIVEEWSFTTEGDTDAPYIGNQSPASGATNVDASTNIVFRLKDYKSNGGVIPGKGVDTGTITIQADSTSQGQKNYTCDSSQVTCDASNPNNVLVTLNPSADYAENEQVTITVNASDLNGTPNVMSEEQYSFTTEDTVAPTVSNFTPTANSTGSASTTNISFHIIDGGAGVAIETLQVYVNNDSYIATDDEVTVGGDASDYTITIDPPTNFTEDTAVVTRISVRDQAPSLNYISPNPTLYTFIVGLGSVTTTVTTTITVTTTAGCSSCCPTCSGGGAVYIKVEKECPVCTSTIKDDDGFIPTWGSGPGTTNQSSTVSASVSCPPAIGGQIQTLIRTMTSTRILYVTSTFNLATGSWSNIWVDLKGSIENFADIGMLFDYAKNDYNAKIEKINGNKLSKWRSVIRIKETEGDIVFEGTSEAENNEIIPLVIYTENNGKQIPLVFHVRADDSGSFKLKIKNVLSIGKHNVSYFSLINGSEIKESKLATFYIDIVKKSEPAGSQVSFFQESQSSMLFLLLFALIFIASVLTVIFARSFTSGAGIVSLFLLSIIGIIMSLPNQRQVAGEIDLKITQQTIDKLTQKQEQFEILREQSKVKISALGGLISDPLNGTVHKNLLVSVREQQTNTDDNGRFLLKDVYSTDIIKISGTNLDKPLYVEVGNIETKIVHINNNLLNTLALIEADYKQRKFKSVYSLGADEFKTVVDESQFVSDKNRQLLDRIKKYAILEGKFETFYTMHKKWKSSRSGLSYTDVVEVNFIYSGYNDNDGSVRLKEPWYFVESNNEWGFVE
ncbi:MAG: Ig-like domain-containing protein [bacterium]